MQSCLTSLSGIHTVKINPVTGRVLVFFDPQSVFGSPKNLLPAINKVLHGHLRPRPAGNVPQVSWLGTVKGQALMVGAYGFLLILSLTTQLFFRGRGSTALTPLLLIQSGNNILSGYPFLRRMVGRIPRVGGVSGPVVVTTASLAILALTRSPLASLTGLMVSISSFSHLRTALEMRRRQTALMTGGPNFSPPEKPELVAREWLDLPADLPELEHYARRISVIAFGLALVLAAFGNPLTGLAVLIVANPRAAYTSATVSLAAFFAELGSRGILVNRYEAVPRLARIQNIIFEAPGVLTAPFPMVAEVIVYRPGLTKGQVVSYIHAALRDTNLPVAKALDDYLKKNDVQSSVKFTRKTKHAKGVSGIAAADEVLVGSLGFLRNKKITIRPAQNAAAHFRLLQQKVFGLAINGALAGLIAIGCDPSPEVGQALEKLRCMGFYRPLVRRGQCPALSAELGLEPRATLRPEDRLLLVAGALEPVKHGEKPYISVAANEAISQIRPEADLILSGSWTGQIPFLMDYGRILKELNRQNAILSGGVGVIGMILILTGQISIATAAVINELVNLAVALNANRLAAIESPPPKADNRPIPVGAAPNVKNDATAEYAVSCELSPQLPITGLRQPLYWQQGLSRQEVAGRLAQFGPNQLVQQRPPGWFKLFCGQFQDVASLTLIGAGGVATLMGHLADTLTIMAILVLNAALGASQEFKAERSLQAMRQITAPRARVLRDGMITLIDTADLVPGDCLLLESGDRVPADSLIVTGNGVSVEEAMLTGEAEPVSKYPFFQSDYLIGTEDALSDARPEAAALPGANKPVSACLLYMGTNVVRGRCKAVVTVTGMRTQMGQIMRLVDGGGTVAPLQSHYQKVSQFLVTGSIIAAAVVSGVGLLTGRGTPLQMIMTGLGMAVAAIPEGLPAIVNIALSSGMQRLARQGALVRRLSAMETLGTVECICADKTGTITGNHLTIREIYVFDSLLSVDDNAQLAANQDTLRALTIGMICNDASGNGRGGFSGDMVDVAFLECGVRAGINPEQLRADYQRILTIPFEAELCYMAIISKAKDGAHYLMVKGAPEKILRYCSGYQSGGQIVPLTQMTLIRFLQACDCMAAKTCRVIAVAYRRETANKSADWPATAAWDDIERDLVLVGLIGMTDPIRPGVTAAVLQSRRSGIKVVMITGDHPKTAAAIARAASILDDDGAMLTGSQMDELNDTQFASIVNRIQVFARVRPAHKLRIVNTLRKTGHRIIMTGDGVNDAPAVKWADVGIAMGTGTEVTKEAAALILVNDGFATIGRAVDEGRNINDNVQAALEFLVAGNSGEMVMMALAVLSGVPLPLLPLHILLVNLFTDGLPALGLALREPPPARNKRVALTAQRPEQDPRFYYRVTSRGLLTGATSLGVYLYALRSGFGINRARTMAFASIVGCQFVQLTHWPAIGIQRANWLRDDPQLGKMIWLSWGGLLASLYLPGLATLFGFTPLTVGNWVTVMVPAVGGAGVTSAWEALLNRHPIPRDQNINLQKGGM
ncbi:MAG: HAD-IC family P-type ATPase [Bacillota bacterium]